MATQPGPVNLASSLHKLELDGAEATASGNETKARDKVLALPELVERVLLHLTPHDITKAKQVSKLWNDICYATKQIRLAGALKPTHTLTLGGGLAWMTQLPSCVPYYDAESSITFHPLIPHDNYYRLDHRVQAFLVYQNSLIEERLRVLDTMTTAFVTSPPCTAVGLEVSFYSEMAGPVEVTLADTCADWADWSEERSSQTICSTSKCVVYRLEGVRVKDMLEIGASIIQNVPTDAWDVDVHAMLSCEAWHVKKR